MQRQPRHAYAQYAYTWYDMTYSIPQRSTTVPGIGLWVSEYVQYAKLYVYDTSQRQYDVLEYNC